MSTQMRPTLRRVLSDTSRIISSNSLHFAALSLLFIFPIFLFNTIHSITQPPSPFNSDYRRLLSSFDTSQILPKLRYALALLLFNIFSVSSVTHTAFHAFHKTPIKLSSSLKSTLSSFLPLLATKLVYTVIFVDIVFISGICMAFVFLSMMVLGLDTGPATTATVLATMVALVALAAYLGVKWCLVDAVVVVESKHGFAPLGRSSGLVKGMRRVALVLLAVPAVLHGIMSAWNSVLAGGGCGGGVAVQMVAYAVLSTAVTLFGVAANAVLFIHCKAVNGESEGFSSDEKKPSQVYVQLPRDVVDEV